MTAEVVAVVLMALMAGLWAGLLLGLTVALVVLAWRRHAHRRHQAQRRRRFSPAERHRVLARDGYRCRWCGAADQLEVDHVVPFARGGVTHITNAQTLCRSCNASKGAR